MYQEVNGDLIQLALEGNFDVITHGCNCFCTMGAGIAPKMAKAFSCDQFKMEHPQLKGHIDKLGNIDGRVLNIFNQKAYIPENSPRELILKLPDYKLTVVNSYTQYGFGSNHSNGVSAPIDYEALILCMRKINFTFKGQRVGLPQIGCGLAGGDWNVVKAIIQRELKDCNITIVIFK